MIGVVANIKFWSEKLCHLVENLSKSNAVNKIKKIKDKVINFLFMSPRITQKANEANNTEGKIRFFNKDKRDSINYYIIYILFII